VAAGASSSSPTPECWSVGAAQGGAPARRLRVPGHHGLRRRPTPALGGPELLLPGAWCLLPFIALLRLRARTTAGRGHQGDAALPSPPRPGSADLAALFAQHQQ
jgi:hypothetical protein